jgi:hypothetical protein
VTHDTVHPETSEASGDPFFAAAEPRLERARMRRLALAVISEPDDDEYDEEGVQRWLPHKLERALALLGEHPEVDEEEEDLEVLMTGSMSLKGGGD